MKHFTKLSVAAVLLAGLSLSVSAAPNPKTGLEHAVLPKVTQLESVPNSTLLAGNSFMYYNNGVVQWLQGMMNADHQTKMGLGMVTIAYSALNWHDMKGYLRPDAMKSITVFDNKVAFNNVKGTPFDAIVMQDNSVGPIHPQLKKQFTEYMKIHSEDIRKGGATPLIMLTWAFPGKPEMTQQLADATIEAANDNNVMVVPVGLAFAEALKKDPNLRLIAKDDRHPSVAGTYLETCVLYATLTKKSPVGLNWYGLGDLTVSKETGRLLQTVAWDTVSRFFGWK